MSAQSGQNPVVVNKRLGDANVSITSDIRAHALPGGQKQAIGYLNRLSGGKVGAQTH